MLKVFSVIQVAIFIFVGLFTALEICAAATPEEVKAALEQRAVKYWAARQSRDLRTVYEMESASLPGGWLKPENASAVSGLPVRNVKVEEVTVEGERGKVRVSGNVLVGTLGWVQLTLNDSWVLINDQWYHESRRPGSPAG